MQFAKASLALSLAAATGLSGLSAINPAASKAATRCTAGTLLGRYTLKSQLTNQYVRAGIGSGAYVGAKSNRVGGNTSWETFDVYDLGNRNGLNGGTYALRSTQDPNRWVGVNNQKALQLQRGCTTNSRSRLFRANKIGRVLQLQSLANGQWVIQRSNGMLHANAATTGGNVPKALQFRMGRVSSPSPSPTPAPGPSASNLTGTWRGNNAGSYTIRQTGSIVSWNGRGGNFRNMFIGQRQGNTVSGYWQDTAGSQTQNSGRLTFKIVNGSELVRVSHTGALGNSRWSR